MKKMICLLLALLLISSGAMAGSSISSADVATPKSSVSRQESEYEAPAGLNMADVLSALKGDEISAYEAVEKNSAEDVELSGFGLTLHVIDAESPLYSMLDEIVAFTVEMPVSEYLGNDAVSAALPLLPEGIDPAALVMDELYRLTVSGYDSAFGDIEAAFEFVTEYPGETVLLAFAGLLPAPDSEENAILWLPMQALLEQGKVCVRLPAQALEAANAAENTVAFALLRAE